MKAYQVKEDIYFVGAIDWNLREFHGYSTSRGSTYNAFLILDEKITLIDNVKAPFLDEMVARISSIIDPSRIDVIISNHGEPDHSGCLLELIKLAPNAKVYSSAPNGVKILKAMYGDIDVIGVKHGDSISIGKRTLTFYQAPMVHWPDNMVTYSKEDKVLFSNDIFGQHFAVSNCIDGANDKEVVLQEARKYYANIVLPYTSQAHKIAELVKGLDIEFIATSHGVCFQNYLQDIIALYEEMTTSTQKEKAVIVYDTMWGATKKLAQTLAETFMEAGIKVTVYNLEETEGSDIIVEIMDAKYLCVGSPTFNNLMLPSVAKFLHYLRGLAPKNLKYIAFGSYGWGGQSVELIEKELDATKLVKLLTSIRQYYVPGKEQITQIKQDVMVAIKHQ